MAKKRVNKKERTQKRALLGQRTQEVKALREQLAERDEQIRKLEERVSAQRRELEEGRRRIARLESDLQSKQSALDGRHRELAALTRRLDQKEKAYRELLQRYDPASVPEEIEMDGRGAPLSLNSGGNRAARRGLGRWLVRRKQDKRLRQQAAELTESELFDSEWYLAQYPDVAEHERYGREPALHYLEIGGFEGRNPSPYFDSVWYLAVYPDVAERGRNPLLHYLRQGRDEGRAPRGEYAAF